MKNPDAAMSVTRPRAPFLVVSPGVLEIVYGIYSDMLLLVSPFTVKLATEFVKQSIADGFCYARQLVEQNRKALYATNNGTDKNASHCNKQHYLYIVFYENILQMYKKYFMPCFIHLYLHKHVIYSK